MGCVFRSLEIRENKPSGLEIISWKYIEKVYEIESAKPNMLRFLAPKLTKQHIELPAFSKMKVKRAAQIFSNTVQAAMMTYIMFRSFATRSVSYGSFCEKHGRIV